MLTSLIDSHPDISCRFANSSVDVGVFHFHALRWDWLENDQIRKVLLERDIFEGSISEMVSPHGHRANGKYTLDPWSVVTVMRRRKLHTELLRRHAGLVLKYEVIAAGGKEIFNWRSDELCDFLGVARQELICSMRKLRKMVPRNLEELRA